MQVRDPFPLKFGHEAKRPEIRVLDFWFSCFCGAKLKSKPALYHHQMACPEAFPCFCGLTWRTTEERLEHLETCPISFRCNCGATFKTDEGRDTHIRTCAETLSCFCGSMFVSRAVLIEHKKKGCQYVTLDKIAQIINNL